MKKPFIILTSLLCLIVLLTITRAVVANSYSTSGVDLDRLDQEIDTYKRQTALLEEKVLTASAYSTLEKEAEQRGYESMSSQIVLSAPLPIAYNQ